MGVRIASSGSTTILNASIANNVEGVIATTGGLGLVQDNAQVLLHVYLNVSVGAGAVTLTVRLRRGTNTAGTLIGVAATPNIVASTTGFYSFTYVDTPGVVTGVQYTATCGVSGGAAALTVNDVCIVAIVL